MKGGMNNNSVKVYRYIKQHVEAIMTGEGKTPFFSLASVLYTMSLLYGFGQKLREFAYRQRLLPSHQLPCKVICIGNLTVGGTGKTPMVIYLAHFLAAQGFKARFRMVHNAEGISAACCISTASAETR